MTNNPTVVPEPQPDSCKMCGREITTAMISHVVYQPSQIQGARRELQVCGQCFLLCNIIDKLSEMNRFMKGAASWQTSKALGISPLQK